MQIITKMLWKRVSCMTKERPTDSPLNRNRWGWQRKRLFFLLLIPFFLVPHGHIGIALSDIETLWVTKRALQIAHLLGKRMNFLRAIKSKRKPLQTCALSHYIHPSARKRISETLYFDDTLHYCCVLEDTIDKSIVSR